MTQGELLEVAREGVLLVLIIAGPVLGVALMVGLVVALFQALTQMQEMTLAFVPKIVAIFLSLFLLLPFMATQLVNFMERIADRIVSMG